MSHASPEIRILVEVPACDERARDLLHACAHAASEAGADALRIGPAGEPQVRDLDAWVALRKAVLRLDLDLVVTVTSPEDVGFFRRVGVGGLAVSTSSALGEALWDAVSQTHLPVVLLSDVAPDPSLHEALACLQRNDVEVTVLFGSAERPSPPEHLGLGRAIPGSLGRGVLTGLADRSGTGWVAVAACALGSDVVELPIALSPYLPGGDGAVSPEVLRTTVEGLRYLAWARAHDPAG